MQEYDSDSDWQDEMQRSLELLPHSKAAQPSLVSWACYCQPTKKPMLLPELLQHAQALDG